VYWVHNFHINPTNICEAHCRFCSFKKGPQSPFAYVMSVEDVIEQVHQYPMKAELSEFHIVSGLYEKQGLAYYEALFKALKKEFPHVHIKALTAVELDYLANLEGIPVEEAITLLKAAGLQSLPGGGAEVFAERVRQAVCVDKISAEKWLHIHGLAHQMGLKSNATMLAGLGETPEERVDHILAIRNQQDQSGGFMTFIPLNCYYENNAVDAGNALTGVENLKNFALSRILLDNVPHIKSFWIHIGEKLTQVSLNFGVDDIDGTVVQEKIAHSAGTEASQSLTRAELLNLIWKAGKIPVERDTVYNHIRVYPANTAPQG
jgi:aminodeoxyfutalosine synthase